MPLEACCVESLRAEPYRKTLRQLLEKLPFYLQEPMEKGGRQNHR